MGEQDPPGDTQHDAPPQPSPPRRNVLRLPRGRRASPWTIPLLLIAAIVAVLLAPLWIDTATLNSIFAVTPTSAPLVTEKVGQPKPLLATDDPRLTWTVIGRDAVAGAAIGWGAADLGGTWHLSSSTDLSVATLDDLSAHDVEVEFGVVLPALPAADALVAAAFLRESADGAAFVPQIQIDGTGTVSVAISVVEGGALRALEPPTPISGLVAAPNMPMHVRTQVTGSDPAMVRMRVWSTTEPDDWQASAVDWTSLLQRAGGLGLAWSAAATPGPQFTDFTATSADNGESQ